MREWEGGTETLALFPYPSSTLYNKFRCQADLAVVYRRVPSDVDIATTGPAKNLQPQPFRGRAIFNALIYPNKVCQSKPHNWGTTSFCIGLKKTLAYVRWSFSP